MVKATDSEKLGGRIAEEYASFEEDGVVHYGKSSYYPYLSSPYGWVSIVPDDGRWGAGTIDLRSIKGVICTVSGWYGPVNASDFIRQSSASVKTNILPYDGALEKVLETQVCEYDLNNGGHEVGIIADDINTPIEIVTDMPKLDDIHGDIKGVSIYSMNALTMRALQEHYIKREAEITDAQLASAEAYEQMCEQETTTQLAMAELYETMIGVA